MMQITAGLAEILRTLADTSPARKIASYRAFILSPGELEDLQELFSPGARRILRAENGTLYAGLLLLGPNQPLNLFSYFFACPISELPKGEIDHIWVKKVSKEACQSKSQEYSTR